MGDTSIRISDGAKRRLDLLKRDGESYDDVIRRLATRDKWAGFGVLEDDQEAFREAVRGVREETRRNMTDDIEETGSGQEQ